MHLNSTSKTRKRDEAAGLEPTTMLERPWPKPQTNGILYLILLTFIKYASSDLVKNAEITPLKECIADLKNILSVVPRM